MKIKELKLKTDAELATMLAAEKAAVAGSKFGRVFKNQKDTAAAGKSKKIIARILTLMSEKKAKSTT